MTASRKCRICNAPYCRSLCGYCLAVRRRISEVHGDERSGSDPRYGAVKEILIATYRELAAQGKELFA